MIESTVLEGCMTPFGSPVVPDGKMTSATSLGSVPGSVPRSARDSQAVAGRAANGRMPGPGAPRPTKTSRSAGAVHDGGLVGPARRPAVQIPVQRLVLPVPGRRQRGGALGGERGLEAGHRCSAEYGASSFKVNARAVR